MPVTLARFLQNLEALILDMDGVLWQGDAPLPGMPDLFAFLRERKIRFLLVTNNSSLTPESYSQKIARMGVKVSSGEIITSASATGEYLKMNSVPGERAFVIGGEGLKRAIRDAGLQVTPADDLQADYVVCGMDRELTWAKLANATINLRRGARFIGTNPDFTFPTEQGIAHGNGAILAALAAASGKKPVVIGKPFPFLFQESIRRLGVPKTRVAVLGDRLETDILGAKRAGLKSILVLTGVTDRRNARKSPFPPTWIVKDIPSLLRSWPEPRKRFRG
jgi:HAD superfamily hydrolase (TIGR01457 family)